jgi:farnesol dehydrogenase
LKDTSAWHILKGMLPLAGKKILILGGTGFLGSNLAHHIVNNPRIAPALIRVFYLTGTPTDSLRDLQGLDLFPGDILSQDDVTTACHGIDLVFHMAASTSFDPSRKRQQWLVNVEGTRNVLEAVRQSPSIQKICYTSTVNTLGVPDPSGSFGNFENSDPYANQHRLHSFRSKRETLAFIEDVRQGRLPRWEKRIGLGYFDSKLAAQELVQFYAGRHGLNVVSALPGTAFGPYDFLIGNGTYLLTLFHNKMPGVLKGGISAAHVMDVVEGHILAMESGAPGSRYIISGKAEDNLRLKDAMKIMAGVLRERFPGEKIRTPSLVIPSPAAYIAAFFSEKIAAFRHRPCLLSRAAVKAGSQPLFYSCENAARDLGYKPVRTFRQGVEEMTAYLEKEGLFESRGRTIDRQTTLKP